MKLPPALENLHKIKHAKIIGVLLAILLNVCLLLFNAYFPSQGSYYLLLAGSVAITFFFLYLFGIRDGKWLAGIGIAVFLIIGMINGILIVHSYYSQPEPDPAESAIFVDWDTTAITDIDGGNHTHEGYWYRMDSGNMTPYKSGVGNYNFQITLYSDEPFITPPDMRVAIGRFLWGDVESPSMTEVDPADINYLDGKDFAVTHNIQENWIYFHWFSLVYNTTTTPTSLNTTSALGPLVGSETSLYAPLAGIGTVSMFCNVGMLFLIVVLLYWWLGTAKKKREQWLEQPEKKDDDDDDDDDEPDEEPDDDEASSDEDEAPPAGGDKAPSSETEKEPIDDDEEFTCTSCGSTVTANHNFCPQCGEKFEGIEDEPEDEDEAPSDDGDKAPTDENE